MAKEVKPAEPVKKSFMMTIDDKGKLDYKVEGEWDVPVILGLMETVKLSIWKEANKIPSIK